MGRPRAKSRRSEVLQIRMTPEELAAFTRFAKSQRIAVSTLARKLLLEAAERPPQPPPRKDKP